MSLDSGIVSHRYKSNASCYGTLGAATDGNYIIASACFYPVSLLIYNIAEEIFSIKLFSGTELEGLKFEQRTRR